MYVSILLQTTNIKDRDACLDSIDYVHTTHCWLLKVWNKLLLQVHIVIFLNCDPSFWKIACNLWIVTFKNQEALKQVKST